MITENGYYRVLYEGSWIVAEFVAPARWYLAGVYDWKLKESFSEIDPQRILMPDEKEDRL